MAYPLPVLIRPPKNKPIASFFDDSYAARICRCYTEECVEKMVDLMRNAEDEKTQLIAAKELLKLGYETKEVYKVIDGTAKDLNEPSAVSSTREWLAEIAGSRADNKV